MRLALGWAGIRPRAAWSILKNNSFLVGPRPYFPFQKRQTTAATCDPPVRSFENR
jgi:hypothetical protein